MVFLWKNSPLKGINILSENIQTLYNESHEWMYLYYKKFKAQRGDKKSKSLRTCIMSVTRTSEHSQPCYNLKYEEYKFYFYTKRLYLISHFLIGELIRGDVTFHLNNS